MLQGFIFISLFILCMIVLMLVLPLAFVIYTKYLEWLGLDD